MAASTRPLTLGEILDRTVQLYRRNFLLFAGISALPAAMMVLAFGGIGILLSSQVFALKPDRPDGAILLAVFLIIGSLIGIPLLLAAFSLALGASNYAVVHAIRNEKVTIRASYADAFRHFWRHLGILFLQVLLAWVVPYLVFLAISFVGAIVAALLVKSGGDSSLQALFVFLLVVLVIVMVVTCVLIWLRFSLAFAATTAEDKKVWPSMQRSGQLSKGTRGRIFVMFLMVGFLSAAVTFALLIPLIFIIALAMQKSFQGPTPPTGFIILIETAYLGIAFLVRAFVMPIYTTSLLLFYYDQRIRLEGYDIELLMAEAGWSEIAAPPPPPAQPQAPRFPFAPIPPPPFAVPADRVSPTPALTFPEVPQFSGPEAIAESGPAAIPESHPESHPESSPAIAPETSAHTDAAFLHVEPAHPEPAHPNPSPEATHPTEVEPTQPPPEAHGA